jgi:hypothetical protein
VRRGDYEILEKKPPVCLSYVFIEHELITSCEAKEAEQKGMKRGPSDKMMLGSAGKCFHLLSIECTGQYFYSRASYTCR